MREYVARAYLHRHRMGVADALPAAQLLAAGIENPLFQSELAAAMPAVGIQAS
jgi:hypothetical protein